jgi:hypothetical protein
MVGSGLVSPSKLSSSGPTVKFSTCVLSYFNARATVVSIGLDPSSEEIAGLRKHLLRNLTISMITHATGY